MFRFYVDLASVHGIPAGRLLEELPGGEALLMRRRKWLDWEEYLQLVERFEALIGGPAPAIEAFREGTFRQVVRPFNAVVSYLTTARHVYWAGARWFAPSLYRHLKFAFDDLDEKTVLVSLTLPEGYRASETFFRHWGASMRFAPLQIGLPESEVSISVEGQRAEYRIRLPARRDVVGRLRAWVRAVFRSSDVLDEITRHQEEVQAAYETLVEAHQVSEEALRRSEWTQRTLLESLPDLIVTLDAEGRIEGVQGSQGHSLREAFVALLGRPLRALSESFEALDRQNASALSVGVAEVAASGVPRYLELSVAAGSERLVYECRIGALLDGRALCVVRDISERRRLESQLRISDRMASLGTMAAALAHEINNPLAAVLNELELLRRGVREPGHDPVASALEAGRQIREIVGQLRLFTRASGEDPRPIDVNALLESMLRMTAHRLKHSATVERALTPLPPVLADQARLGQVFMNLLINAAQAMPEGEVARNVIRVRTEVDASGKVAVEISDTGAGIPEEDLARIFDPFWTTKSLNEGTGLGLAICQRIVSDLGGTIEVRSELEKGSVFRVLLPSAPGAVKTLPASTGPAASAVSTPARRRVLVVDDNPRFAFTVKMLLREHDVTVVHSGEEGAKRLLDEGFDVALCDLMMPEVSGIELYRRVSSAGQGIEGRIVFMTGGAFTNEARDFLAGMGNRYLQKPFRPEELEAMIARVT